MAKKKKCQMKHAKRRFQERFGMTLTQNIHEQMISDIRHGRAVFVQKQSNRVSVFDLTVEDTPVRVVYDKQRRSIATVLDPQTMPLREIEDDDDTEWEW
jgi:AraC-like DNA-binding protein